MTPVLVPLAERAGRAALHLRGVKSHTIDVPAGRMHVYDVPGTGDLPTLVLFHGISASATPFAPLFLRLARHFRRIVVPEYPGHGFSAEPVGELRPEQLFESVHAAVDRLVDEPAIFVGNSLGGLLALQMAVASPEKVRALVLLSPAGAQATPEEWETLRNVFALRTRADAVSFVQRIYHRPPWYLSFVVHELPGVVYRRAVRDLLASASNDHMPHPAALRDLPMPVLLVWGQSERLLPDTHFRFLKEHLPAHAVIERPKGYGHCPHFDRPGQLARRIERFARNVVAAERDGAVSA